MCVSESKHLTEKRHDEWHVPAGVFRTSKQGHFDPQGPCPLKIQIQADDLC